MKQGQASLKSMFKKGREKNITDNTYIYCTFSGLQAKLVKPSAYRH